MTFISEINLREIFSYVAETSFQMRQRKKNLNAIDGPEFFIFVFPLFFFQHTHTVYLCSYGDHVQHFKVLKDKLQCYFIWDEVFTSLNQLVEFYRVNSIAKERTVFLREAERLLAVRAHTHTLIRYLIDHRNEPLL